MKKLLLLLFSILFILLFSLNSFAQEGYYEDEPKVPFQPMLSFGTGSYLFKGDVMGPKKNLFMGNQGFHFGVKMNMIDNLYLTFLVGNGRLNENNDVDSTSFSSDVRTAGLDLQYNFSQISKIKPFLSLGAEFLNFKTDKQAIKSTIAIPLGIGVMLNVSERIEFDMGVRYHYSLTDLLDDIEEGSSDKFLVTTFTIHYDLFTPEPRQPNPYDDDSFYADINFNALDTEDSDGDLVVDINDYCPETPVGVTVDPNGCPLDDDKDGIPNYVDQETNTPRGSIVNEKGLQLTDEQSKSMYSKYNAASREYANYYNENEISKDKFISINEYLIAKANAFNNVNNVTSIEQIKQKRFAVMLGEYRDEIPATVINTYLSFEDLESLPQEDGRVIYTVGSYNTGDQAMNRQSQLDNQGLNNTNIVEIENGIVSYCKPHSPAPNVTEKASLTLSEQVKLKENVKETIEKEKTSTKVGNSLKGKITFRIQISASKIALSKDIFKGVPNVISFTSGEGLIRYFTGSFSKYKDAVQHQNNMLLRGFEGSFVVAFKDGEKIGLYSAIRGTNGKLSRRNTLLSTTNVVKKEETKLNLKFVVQIGVYKENLSANVLSKMSKIENVNKENVNDSKLFRYIAGNYNDYSSADARLKEVKEAGFNDAFIKPLLDGNQISIEQAKTLTE